MLCAFCKEFDEERTADSRIIWEDRDFRLLPTKGCLCPGYCLFMPVEHVTSFAMLPEHDLCNAAYIMEDHRLTLEKVFGKTIMAEHGSGGYCKRGASCCDHAHLHLIPILGQEEQICDIYKEIGGPPKLLFSLASIKEFAGEPYILLSPEVGVYWVWTNTDNFRRQFVRWAVARVFGIEEQYDWREHSFSENMELTKRLLVPRMPASVAA